MQESVLKNKVAIITGASRGIGKSIVEEFARHGAVVYSNIRTDSPEIDEWIIECNKIYPGKVKKIVFDLRDSSEIKKGIMDIKQKEKKIDILVNNAGIEYNENIGMITNSHIEDMFKVNVYAVIELTQLVARIMMRENQGSIINMASVVGRYGSPGQSAYSATKGAVMSFTKSAAKELGKYNIRVNAIAPGITKTGMIEQAEEKFIEKRVAQVPLKRLADPSDIAKVCVFLGSDMSSFMSGQVLGVDGGTTL